MAATNDYLNHEFFKAVEKTALSKFEELFDVTKDNSKMERNIYKISVKATLATLMAYEKAKIEIGSNDR